MGGLFQRALELKQQRSHLRLVRPEELGGDQRDDGSVSTDNISGEDISSEEREQILSNIDKFVEHNRLEIKSDTFKFTPKQSGLLLPTLINISAIILFVIGFFLFSYIFDQRQESIVSETKTLLTAESKLIEALKKESQAQIDQKDRQIQEIQSKLTDIDGEREQLKRDSDMAIQQREQELRAALEAELEAEKQRLQAAGVSEEEMTRRLQELEDKRRVEYEQQIAEYRIRTEAELAEKDAAIASVATDYQKSLDEARTERLQLQSEAERRQAELQTQFQEKEQSLEADRARMLEELGRLQDQQKTESLVLDQILASYDRIIGLVRDSQYDGALDNLQALRNFLGQDNVTALPIVQRRRPVELFIIGSLEELIQKIYLGSSDTSSLIASSSLLNEIAATVDEANQRFESGEVSGAQSLYEKALQKVTAIWSSHSRLNEIENISLEQEQKKLDSLIAAGDKLYQSKEFRASVDRYTQALIYLKQDAAVATRIVERIMDSASRLLSEDSAMATIVINPVLLERLGTLRREYEDFMARNSATSESSPETLTRLLEAKILVMQIIAAEPVTSEYPELYGAMERYFDAFGKERTRDGQSSALMDVIAVLERITGERDQGGPESLWKSYDRENQRALLLRFLGKLQDLLQQ